VIQLPPYRRKYPSRSGYFRIFNQPAAELNQGALPAIGDCKMRCLRRVSESVGVLGGLENRQAIDLDLSVACRAFRDPRALLSPIRLSL
jgi:hypothetical protein